MSQPALRDGSKEVKEESGYIGVLQQRPGSQNIKRLLLIKENQTSQVNDFTVFLCLGRLRVWAHWNHSFDVHLRASILFFSILHPLSVDIWVGYGGWGLDGCNFLCLLIYFRWHSSAMVVSTVLREVGIVMSPASCLWKSWGLPSLPDSQRSRLQQVIRTTELQSRCPMHIAKLAYKYRNRHQREKADCMMSSLQPRHKLFHPEQHWVHGSF